MPDVPAGHIELFHRTTPEAARAIVDSGTFSEEWKGQPEQGRVYFSTHTSGATTRYGAAVVRVVVPESVATLDDEYPDGERHYWVHTRDIPKAAISLME